MNHLVGRPRAPLALVLGVIAAICLLVTLLGGCNVTADNDDCEGMALTAFEKPPPPRPKPPAVKPPVPLTKVPNGGQGAARKPTSAGKAHKKGRHHGHDFELCDD
ncbi:hypothetical protein ACLQ2N_16515 [Streptomyces sp. DT224]|uniref:hypothetical protein n=1 Tax=Streptomyces sp. DT224 TaxID=3393426 RepID=UPI003CF43E31